MNNKILKSEKNLLKIKKIKSSKKKNRFMSWCF